MLDAPAIVKTLGGDWYGSYGLAPGPGHSKSDRSLKIWIGREGEPRFHSFAGDDWRSVKDELRARGLLQEWNSPWTPKFTHRDAASTQRVPETRKRWSAYAEDMWCSCTRLSGVALEYLHARGCAIPHKDGDLRWHPSLKNKRCRWTGPALVARVTDALSKEPLTLHRTWIAATGKVKIKVSKLPLKGHVKAGGVIRLWPDEDVAEGLGIAEGIETALSGARAFTPMWSAIDAGNLSMFPVLDGIQALTIFADNDPNGRGQKAASDCAMRWLSQGREVRIWTSAIPKQDFNDWATS